MYSKYVISIIIFALKQILNRQLIEAAVRKFEIMNAGHLSPEVSEVVVVVSGNLSESFQKKINQAILKKFNRAVKLTVKKDKTIKGGAIIQIKDVVIDCSLVSRLKEGGIIR